MPLKPSHKQSQDCLKREIFTLDFLDSGSASAEANMELDEKLLETLQPEGSPLLHFYDWEGPSLSYGYFLKVEEEIDVAEAKRRGVSLARRPTGGGVVFHIWDLAFSFLMPASHPSCSLSPLENYQFVNEIVRRAVLSLFPIGEEAHLIPDDAAPAHPSCPSFCMARPTRYDLVYRGKKIAGAAQRRKKGGYLHQGTISLALPDPELLGALLVQKEGVAEAMEGYSFAPLGQNPSFGELTEARQKLKMSLADAFERSIQNRTYDVS